MKRVSREWFSAVAHLRRVIPQIVIEFLRVPPFESFVKEMNGRKRAATECGTLTGAMNQCFRTRDKIRTKFPPYGKINACNPYGEDSVSRTINFIVHCLGMNRRSLRKNEPLSIIHVHFKNYQPSVPSPDNDE